MVCILLGPVGHFWWNINGTHKHIKCMTKEFFLQSDPDGFIFAFLYDYRGAWAIFPGAQPTEQPRRVPKVADRGMTFT